MRDPAATGDLGTTIERSHASDQVFRALASKILSGELAVGVALPPERDLAESFGVSRIIVREAIHRLKSCQLVRVRQGSATFVLDPDDAADVRVMELEIELGPATPEGIQAFAERQAHSGAGLLQLAEQRITEEELNVVERLIDDFLANPGDAGDWLKFERAYWTAIAKATRNRFYRRETTWYFNLLERNPKLMGSLYGSAPERAAFYKELMRPLRARTGSAAALFDSLRPRVA